MRLSALSPQGFVLLVSIYSTASLEPLLAQPADFSFLQLLRILSAIFSSFRGTTPNAALLWGRVPAARGGPTRSDTPRPLQPPLAGPAFSPGRPCCAASGDLSPMCPLPASHLHMCVPFRQTHFHPRESIRRPLLKYLRASHEHRHRHLSSYLYFKNPVDYKRSVSI